jgi:uncharacterized membrane protein
MKTTFKTEVTAVIFIALSWLLSLYFFQHFPALVPIHWDIAGNANGFGSRAFAAFFVPALTLGIYLILLALPILDPKKDRYIEFAKTYHLFKNLIIIMLVAIYCIASFNALGVAIPIGITIPILIGLLFVIMGNYFGKIRRNFFIGIRTPWTLSNEEVWNKTHRFGGKLFIVGGILILLTVFIPITLRVPLFIGTAICIAVIPMIYSYLLFKKVSK